MDTDTKYLLANGREVYLEYIEGSDYDDISFEAYYSDTDNSVTDEEYEYLQEFYAQEISEEWLDNKIVEAEYRFEGDR